MLKLPRIPTCLLLLCGSLLLTPGCQKAVVVPPLTGIENLSADALQLKVLSQQQQIAAKELDNPGKRGSFGMALEANGFHQLASTEYQAAALLDSGDPLWPYRLATIQLESGETERAIADLTAITRRFPAFAPAWHRVAMAHLKSARDEDAETTIGHLLKLAPTSTRGRTSAAEILLTTGDAPEALRILKAVTRQDRGYRWAYQLLGQCYLQVGQSGSSVEALLRNTLDAQPMYEQDPRENQLIDFRTGREHEMKFCSTLIQETRFRNANQRLERALEEFPEDLRLRSMRAEALQGEGNLAAALKELDEIIRLDSTFFSAYLMKVNWQLQEGDRLARSTKSSPREIASHYQRAAEAATAAVTHDPDNWQAHFARGRAEVKLRNDSAARLYLARARELEPASVEVCLSLHDVCLRLNDRVQAAVAIQAATEADPGHLNSWVKLGMFHVMEENLDEAQTALLRAAQINPGHPAVHSLRSRITSLLSKGKAN